MLKVYHYVEKKEIKKENCMRKLMFVLLLLSLSLVLTNCSSMKYATVRHNTESMHDSICDALKIFNFNDIGEHGLYVIGDAKNKSKKVAIEEADAQAREFILLEVEKKVSVMFESFLNKNLIDDNSEELEFIHVTKKYYLTPPKLKGCQIIERMISFDGDLYWACLIVKYPLNNLIDDVTKTVQKSLEEFYNTKYLPNLHWDKLIEELEEIEQIE